MAGDERIRFALYCLQQIDIRIWYIEGEDEAISRFRIIAVQSE